MMRSDRRTIRRRGGSHPVEMAVGILLMLISLALIAFIVYTVQRNMVKA